MSAHFAGGPVLDYASPRPQGKLRLPSQSLIEVAREREGLVILERLRIRGPAVFAIALAVFTLMTLPAAALADDWRYWRRDFQQAPVAAMFVPVLITTVWLAELGVLLLVVNNTWRRTTVRAAPDALLMEFWSPFRSRRYEWPAAEVRGVRVESTTTAAHRNHLAEVQIDISGFPLVRLFTDHSATDVAELAAGLRRALSLAERPSASLGAQAS